MAWILIGASFGLTAIGVALLLAIAAGGKRPGQYSRYNRAR